MGVSQAAGSIDMENMETELREVSTCSVAIDSESQTLSEIGCVAKNSDSEAAEALSTLRYRFINLSEMTDVRLDDEIAFAVPVLASLEKAGLEDSIVRNNRCTEAVKVWRDPADQALYLVDGFARIEICQRRNLPMPEGVVVEGPTDRAAVIQYRIDEHLNRRSMSPWWIAYLWGAKYNSTKLEPHRPGASDTEPPHNEGETSKRLAEEAGYGHATIERWAKFARAIDTLKRDVSSDFVRRLLDKEFKLSKPDIIALAEMLEADRKAIADVIIANPKFKLSDAERIVHPPETNPDPDPKPDPNGSDQVLDDFHGRLKGYWAKFLKIDTVSHPERLPNVIRTLKDMLKKLEEIEANSKSS